MGVERRDAIACANEICAGEEAFSNQNYRDATRYLDKALLQMESSQVPNQLCGEAYFRAGITRWPCRIFGRGKFNLDHKGCKAGHKLVKSIAKKGKRGDGASKARTHKDAIDYWVQAINIDDTHRAFV